MNKGSCDLQPEGKSVNETENMESADKNIKVQLVLHNCGGRTDSYRGPAKGLEHPQIFVCVWAPGTKSLWY